MPPTALATQAASELGLDITGHTSQPVSAEALERSDLVCCMTASHLRTCVAILPECWERTFTLGGLSTAASTSGMAPISGVGGCDEGPALTDRLRRWHEGRSRRDLLGSRLPGDVVDPAGGTIEEHRAVASEIVRLVTTVVHLTWGRSELRNA